MAVAPDLRAVPPGVAFIEYVSAFDAMYALVITGGGQAATVTARKLPASALHVSEVSREVYKRIAQRDLRFATSARELHRLLLAPLANDIGSAHTLVIVPTGELWNVPFAALIDAHSSYVAERYATVYEPSMTFLLNSSRRNRPASDTTILALGNPLTSRRTGRELASAYRSASLGPLPDAEREVHEIGDLYRETSVVATKADATEALVRKGFTEFDIMHYAVHGVFDDQNPMYSRLVFAPSSEYPDGVLEAWEILAAPSRADLVVLSACDTARGHDGIGEGLTGLTWAFLAAGSQSVLASRWEAESRITASLMVDFHRRFRNGKSKAQSLREAQAELVRKGLHPYYWATFTLTGAP
jgi:CHAT domain-containing protein